jgi:hypothetical protein
MTISSKYRNKCIICFNKCDSEKLIAHNHCCKRSCEKELKTLCAWERTVFGDSLLESISKYC